MYNQQTNIVVCKHNEYINLKNRKHNIESYIQIQHHKPYTYMLSMGGLSGWRFSCQGDVNSALYESLPSGSLYALLERLSTLLSLLPFSVSRVEQRDTLERIRRKGHESAETI